MSNVAYAVADRPTAVRKGGLNYYRHYQKNKSGTFWWHAMYSLYSF